MSDNLKLWESVCKTNPSHTKAVNFGRAITAIDPYQQVRNATEQFGPAGKGWGWEVIRVEHLPTNELGILVRLWHGSNDRFIEQWGQSSLYIDKAEKKKDGDCFKKATTDGITKCLSYLGFNADVFLGKFDDNKYVQDMKDEFKKEDPNVSIIIGKVVDNDTQWVKDNWNSVISATWSQLDQITTEKLNTLYGES